MNLKTRRIEIVGVTVHPDSAWVRQMGRNLTDAHDGFLLNYSHILIAPDGEVGNTTGIIDCRELLGGLLRFYHRRAA